MSTGNEKKNRPGLLGRPYAFLVFTVLAVMSLLFAWRSYSAPVQIVEETVKGSLKQEVTFNYNVTPRVSALYPEPQQQSGRAIYLTRITESLKTWVRVDIYSEPLAALEGTSEVLLKLKSGDYWEKDYVLSPETEFKDSGNFTVINTTFNIPLQDILAFIKSVEEETQVYPDNGYTLELISLVKAKGQLEGEPLVNEFTGSFPFMLTPRELAPQGKPRQENISTITGSIILPGIVHIPGRDLPVITARYISGVSFLVFAGIALFLFTVYRRSRLPLSEAQSIYRRYRGSIVSTSGGFISDDMTVIRLATFKELLKLSHERDKSIVLIDDNEDGGLTSRYCIPDGNILYCYAAQGSAVGRLWRPLGEQAVADKVSST